MPELFYSGDYPGIYSPIALLVKDEYFMGIKNVARISEYYNNYSSDIVYRDIIRLGLYDVNSKFLLLKNIIIYLLFLIFFINVYDLTLYKPQRKPLISKVYKLMESYDLGRSRIKTKDDYPLGE
jgi:hypothetical protein